MSYQQQVAQAILQIGAVGFKPRQPLTFKSGIISPVYVDNRRFPFHPEAWQVVIDGFQALIDDQQLDFDVIAGIETAGIPHSAALGFAMQRPSVFVRKKIKDHGTKSRVEGGTVTGKKVVLLEDLVTTGGSSLAGVEALRADGAVVEDCLIIVDYGFKEAQQAFAKAQVALHALTSFPVILAEAEARNLLNNEDKKLVENWLSDPWGWGKRHGFEEGN